MGQHLWMTWLQIASEHAWEARQERTVQHAVGDASDTRFNAALPREMQAAMVAVSSSAHAIDALYGEVKPLVPIPRDVVAAWENNDTPRHRRILETLKCGCRLGSRTNTWPRRFSDLYVLRDPLVHHELRVRPSVPHPNGLVNVSQEMADYSVESALESVNLATDVIITTLSAATAPDLVRWADRMQHIPAFIQAVGAAAVTGVPPPP